MQYQLKPYLQAVYVYKPFFGLNECIFFWKMSNSEMLNCSNIYVTWYVCTACTLNIHWAYIMNTNCFYFGKNIKLECCQLNLLFEQLTTRKVRYNKTRDITCHKMDVFWIWNLLIWDAPGFYSILGIKDDVFQELTHKHSVCYSK